VAKALTDIKGFYQARVKNRLLVVEGDEVERSSITSQADRQR